MRSDWSTATSRWQKPAAQDSQLGNPASIGVVVGRLLADVIPVWIADPEPVDDALTVHDLARGDIEHLVNVIARLKPREQRLQCR